MDVVLNWLAQGILVAIAAAVALRVIAPSRPQARYTVIWTACLLVLALPAIPLLLSLSLSGPSPDLTAAPAGPLVSLPAAWWASSGVAVNLWIVWSVVHAVQLVRDAVAVHRAKRCSREVPSDLFTQLPYWPRVSATGRPARVVVSSGVQTAAVLGCGSPVIALAPKLTEQLNAVDLDRVLIHEWAHVQRYDDVAQLAQRLVRVAIGWHPAIWWLERQMEFEREAACDEMVVRVTGTPKAYAVCLTTVAALSRRPLRPLPGPAAVSPSRLHRRIVRILASPLAARPWRAVGICGAMGLTAYAGAVGHLRVVASAVTPAAVSVAAPIATGAPSITAPAASPHAGTDAPAATAGTVGTPRFRGRALPEAVMAQRDNPTQIEVQPGPAAPLALLRADWTPDRHAFLPLDIRGSAHSRGAHQDTPIVPEPSATEQDPAQQSRAPWRRAADAGTTIGRATRGAGISTAGFLSRFGKRIAGSF